MMRLASFAVVASLAYLAPFWLFLLCTIAYALAFRHPYELFLPAALVDAAFGGNGELFGLKYVLSAGAIVFIAAYVKQYLRTNTNFA